MTIGYISEGTKYRVDGKLFSNGNTIPLENSTLYVKENVAYFTDFNNGKDKSIVEVKASGNGKALFEKLTQCTDMTLSIRN